MKEILEKSNENFDEGDEIEEVGNVRCRQGGRGCNMAHTRTRKPNISLKGKKEGQLMEMLPDSEPLKKEMGVNKKELLGYDDNKDKKIK